MQRIDNATSVSSLPSPASPGTPGYFTDGNPNTGAPPTIVPAEWLNRMQEESMSIILGCSLTPSKTNYAQMAQAIISDLLCTVDDSSGSANTVVANLPVQPVGLNKGLEVKVRIANTNTGASTLNVNSLGATAITYKGSALAGGELKTGQYATFKYDGSSFQLTSVSASTPTIYTGGVTTGSANTQAVTVTPAGFALVYGNIVSFNASLSNTGAMTLNVNSTGNVTIKKRTNVGLSDVASGDINAGEDFMVLYDGVYYELIDPIIPVFGALATLNIGAGLKNDGSGNLAVTYTISSSAPSGGNDGDTWYQI